MDTLTTEADWPARWDPAWIERRARLEGARRAGWPEDAKEAARRLALHYRTLRWGLKASRLYARGYRNYTDLRVTRLNHRPAGWPAALDGFRILQLSDLHLDLDPALVPAVLRVLEPLQPELAVITGDFWEGLRGVPGPMLDAMRRILAAIGAPAYGCFGVLGNHDSLAIAAALEGIGLRILLNEAVTLDGGGGAFALAGVDDAFYFGTGDVARAAGQCPDGLPRLLLSHSPQLAAAASRRRFALMLSGHTHGGQVCLPGGRQLFPMKNVPRRLYRGLWRQGPLLGYTSTGTGACHVPVRFNCPPEIVIHTLRSG